LNIKDALHRKRIIRDLKFLKKIYSKNPDESEYIRNKLLKFYEKNRGELFSKKTLTEKNAPLNLGGFKVSVSGNERTSMYFRCFPLISYR